VHSIMAARIMVSEIESTRNPESSDGKWNLNLSLGRSQKKSRNVLFPPCSVAAFAGPRRVIECARSYFPSLPVDKGAVA
jgi:hypothetical protein